MEVKALRLDHSERYQKNLELVDLVECLRDEKYDLIDRESRLMKQVADQKKENKKLYASQAKKMDAILSEIDTLKEVLKMKNVEIESLITLRQQEKDKVYQNSINLDHRETEIKKLKFCLKEAKVQLKCS